MPAVLIEPTGAITPVIDGEVTSYFEWIGAGIYRVDERSGSMHGKKFLVKEVYFGTDGASFFLRVDFHPGYEQDLSGMEAQLTVQSLEGAAGCSIAVRFAPGGVELLSTDLAQPESAKAVECAFGRVLEVRLSLASHGDRRWRADCDSSSPCGKTACRSTPSRSKAGSKCAPPIRRRWLGKARRLCYTVIELWQFRM